MMNDKLDKLLPVKLWQLAVKTVKNNIGLYNNFLNWVKEKYIPEEIKITPDEIKDWVKKQIENSLDDDAKKNALINEYIWQNFRLVHDFAEKYEKDMLKYIE